MSYCSRYAVSLVALNSIATYSIISMFLAVHDDSYILYLIYEPVRVMVIVSGIWYHPLMIEINSPASMVFAESSAEAMPAHVGAQTRDLCKN